MALDTNLKKLTSLLATLDADHLGRQEFTAAFEKVVELVLKVQRQQSEAISELQQTYANLLKNFEDRHNTTLTDLKKQVDGLFVSDRVKGMEDRHGKALKSIDEKLNAVDRKLVTIRSGRDGQNGKDGKDFPVEAVQKMNKDIEGIRTETKKAYEEARKPRSIGGMKKITYSKTMDLSSQVDGVKKVFDLDRTVINVHYLQSSQFPFIYRKTVDFTFTGRQVTLTSAVQAIQPTQTLFAHVDTAFFSK